MLHAAVLAGGVGTRFWPLSRASSPKQFLPIIGKKTMIQETVSRLRGQVTPANTWILTNREYVNEVRRQIPSIPLRNILGEPVGRNTAPCIGIACIMIERSDPEACVLVVTADHHIAPAKAFRDCVKTAVQYAVEHSCIATFGIRPTYPSTGYGYIHTGSALKKKPICVRRGQSFVEKPKLEVAQSFVEDGHYLWNSGMFVFTVPTILSLYQQFLPDIYAGLCEIRDALGTRRERSVMNATFESFRSISIDYGIMNKLTDFVAVEADFEWNDVGLWTSVETIRNKGRDGNVTVGLTEVLKSKGCTVISDNDHLVATVGMSDAVVVHTEDATLVCDKSKVQEVRELVERLKKKKLTKFL